MVVARKTPVAPPPPASRTNSSQPLPRAIKSKKIQQDTVVSSNGDEASIHSAPKRSVSPERKHQSHSHPRSRSYSMRLYLFILSLFTIYAFTTCTTSSTPPICRALQSYRTNILDPYILPPIRNYIVPPIHSAIHHPALAPIHPYVRALSTYEKQALRPRLARLASYSQQNFNTHVVLAYNKHVVDALWEKRIVPTYDNHIHPYFVPLIAQYNKRIPPLYSATSQHAHAAYERVHPHYLRAKPHLVNLARTLRLYAIRAYETVKPHAVKAYKTAKPHLAAVREHAQAKTKRTVGRVNANTKIIVRKVGDARRMYVDVHVKRVWEKIAERETKTMTKVDMESTPPVVKEQELPLKVEPTLTEVASASSVIHGDAQSETVSELVSSASPVDTPKPSPSPVESSQVLEHEHETLSSETSFPATNSVLAQTTPTPEEEHHKQVLEAQSSSHSEFVSESQSPPPSSSSESEAAPSQTQTPVKDNTEEEEEVDDFLKQLGLDETVAVESDPAQTPLSSHSNPNSNPESDSDSDSDTETDAEAEAALLKAKALQETAAKRADITSRHVRWQTELDRSVLDWEKRVRGVLKGMREGAVRELEDMYGGKGGGGVVGVVEGEGRRLVKGLEAYVRKVKVGGDGEKEKEMWERVVGKVEEKFGEKVDVVQKEVREWYVGVREREGGEIQRASAEVKSLAEKAQADVGLDYAWLEDVTYSDWQRYHDLMRTSESFTTYMQRLQNGTLEEEDGTGAEFPDMLVEALGELQAEVEDVVRGFVVSVGRVRRVWEERGVEEKEKEKEESGEEPRVSILPIEPEPERIEGEGDEKEYIFVGRSKEEVERRLSGAGVNVNVEEERVRRDRGEL